MSFSFLKNGFFRGARKVLTVAIFLAVNLSAQSVRNIDEERAAALKKEDEERKRKCESSKNPYCEEIKKITKSITYDSRPEARYYSHHILPGRYASRGDLYLKGKDYKRALSDFNRALADNNRLPLANMGRGDIYLMQGRLNDALEDYQKAASSNIGSARAHLGIGNVYLRKREYDAAFENYQKAIGLNHRLAGAYFGRGVVYIKRGDDFRETGDETLAVRAYKDALYDFNSVIEINLRETDAETYRQQAIANEALGNKVEAEKSKRMAEESKQKEAAKDDPDNDNN